MEKVIKLLEHCVSTWFFIAVQIGLSHTDLPPTQCLEGDIDLQLQSNDLKTNTLPSVKNAFSHLMNQDPPERDGRLLSAAPQPTRSISLVYIYFSGFVI